MTKLLIVDDSQSDLYLLKTLLTNNGYTVSTARNGIEALIQARTTPPNLIISDILMPEMDGFSLCRAWKKDAALKNIPFIFYTATYTDPRDEELALSLGAEKFILKPADPALFIDLLQSVIRQCETGQLVSSGKEVEEEAVYYQRYNEALIRKVEDKMRQIALINRALEQDISERKNIEKELRLLHRLTRSIVSSKDFRAALQVVLEQICSEIGWDFGEAWIPRPNGSVLEDSEVCYLSTENLRRFKSESAKFTFTPGSGLPGRVWSSKQPEWIQDASNQPETFFLRSRIAKELGIKTACGIPISAENEVLAVVAFYATTIQPQSQQLEEFLTTVASQLGLVMKQKRIEEEIRSRNIELALMKQVMEQTVESIIITDTEGVIVYVNPAFERVTGYSQDEAVGHTPGILRSGEHDITFFQELWRTIKAGEIWQGQIINKNKSGTRYVDKVTIIPVRDENGKIVHYAGIQQDVTRDLQTEEQYRQMQKMDAIGQLTAGIAHDFNNILTAINGYAELLQMRFPQEDPVQPFLNNILYSGERATNLIQQLLAFSRRQVIEPKVLNLKVVIEDMSEMLRHMIGEHIRLKTVIAPELWPVKVDPTQIEQVITNLAVNARDAMPDGGQMTLEAANAVLDENYVSSHLDARPGDYVMLSVSDSGCGMNKETLVRIFEPFFTTKEVGKGTGLGLASVYGIVKQNRGNIWVYSEEGKGTTFRIYLPRTVEPLQELPKSASGMELPKGSETILLAEDDDRVRHLAVQILEAHGYRVLEASNGEEAVQLSNRHFGEIRLLLTDVMMPGMSGKTLSEHLRKLRPGIKVLFVSGYSADMMGLQIIRAGRSPFLQKPFSTAQLVCRVREVLDS